MKFILYIKTLLLLVSCLPSLATTGSSISKTSNRSCPLSQLNLTSKRVSCCATVIMASDIGTTGYQITAPGQYCLGEDVVYNPSGTNPAIRINIAAVGNVTLDLNCKTLSQASKNVLNIAGVVIDPGLTNIVIKNGTIRDFSDSGIRAGVISATETIPTITNLNITGIKAYNNGLITTIGDPLFIGDGFGGAVILNAQDITVTDSNFNENFRSGLWATNVVKYTVKNCHCDDTIGAGYLTPGNPTGTGIEVLGLSSDIAILNSTANRTFSTNSAYGLNMGDAAGNTTLTNILVDSCQFNDTAVILSDPAVALVASETGGISVLGIALGAPNALTINNCEIYGTSLTLQVPVTPTFPPLSAGVSNSIQGISIGDGSNVTITNCNVGKQTFTNNTTVGARTFNQSFSLFGASNYYIGNCHTQSNTSIDITVPSLVITEGFDLAAAGNVVIEDCTATGHKQTGTNPAGEFSIVSGFNAHFYQCSQSYEFCGPIILRRCIATGNVDTGTGNGIAAGFATREPQSPGLASGPFVFDSCIAEGNINSSATGSGFDLFDLINSKVINCLAETNNIAFNVTESTAGNSGNNIISDNIFSANTAFGIQDLTSAGNNAYYSNRAKNNGPTPASTNYSGAVFPLSACPGVCASQNLTPVLFWLLPNAPCDLNSNCVAPTVFDNLCIVN